MNTVHKIGRKQVAYNKQETRRGQIIDLIECLIPGANQGIEDRYRHFLGTY